MNIILAPASSQQAEARHPHYVAATYRSEPVMPRRLRKTLCPVCVTPGASGCGFSVEWRQRKSRLFQLHSFLILGVAVYGINAKQKVSELAN